MDHSETFGELSDRKRQTPRRRAEPRHCLPHDCTLEATHLRDRCYAVRPANQLGTCGWHPEAWTVVYVTANNPGHALRLAEKRRRLAPL